MQSAAEARSYFEDTPGVTVVEIPINDGWARDWGPSVSSIPYSLTSVFPFPVAPLELCCSQAHCLLLFASL